MAFRIERGVFKFFDNTDRVYKKAFEIDTTGNFVLSNNTNMFAARDAEGNDKELIIGDSREVQGTGGLEEATATAMFVSQSGGTLTGALTVPRFHFNDSNTTIEEGSFNSIRLKTNHGHIDIGSMNSGWVHMQSDRNIYILPSSRDNQVAIDGNLFPYTDNYNYLGSSSKRWNQVNAEEFRGYGNSTINGDLTVGGTITAQEFHTEFVNSTIIREDGDVEVDGNIYFTGSATTTNQSHGIYWTGFDKEGTTDFSDTAYITHTTNTGGFAGSVLVIHSANDGNDGIAFSTNASSNLKHNGNVIWTAGNDGAGSGLNADQLDGYHASALRSRFPKVEHLQVTTSIRRNDTITLPNSLQYTVAADGFEYLEIYVDGLRLARTIHYNETSTTRVQFLVSIPEGSVITYKSLTLV